MRTLHPLRILRVVGLALLTLLLAAIFLFAVVMGQPQENSAPVAEQPLLTASPALHIEGQGDLTGLIAAYPVPVLACTAQSGWTLVSAASYDAAYGQGFGRVTRLVYIAPDGTALLAESIYPASALDLLGKGSFRLSATPGSLIAGQETVRMVSADAVRYHFQTESGLYAVTLPIEAERRAAELVRGLQLMK